AVAAAAALEPGVGFLGLAVLRRAAAELGVDVAPDAFAYIDNVVAPLLESRGRRLLRAPAAGPAFPGALPERAAAEGGEEEEEAAAEDEEPG
ncbi:unnamed protein product, partial [Prorocentrum cordatum]